MQALKFPVRSLVVFALLAATAGVALAQGAPPPPDPVTTAASSVDGGGSLLLQYGPIWGGMLLAYGLAAYLLRQAESRHWIAQGKVLATIVAGVGLFGSFLESHFGGGQTLGISLTALLAVFKLVNPVVTPTSSTSTPASFARQAGFVRRPLLALLAVFAIVIGSIAACASWQGSTAQKDVDAGIACAKAEASAVQKGESLLAFGLRLTAEFTAAVANGTEEELVTSLIATYGEPVVACAIKQIAGGGAGASSGAMKTSTGTVESLAAAKLLQRHAWKFAPAGAK